jgi:DNA-binding response OmpR family regulator
MSEQEVILTSVKDRNELEGLDRELSKDGFRVVSAPSLRDLVEAIRNIGKVSLAVVDMCAFNEDERLELESLQKASIPFIVLSPNRSPSWQKECLLHGAAGLLTMPLRAKELVEHIHMLLGRA